ncbi:MAG: hypothetical protein HY260_16395, partial [Chloroflexi bacterium]|nr:hypothetical protein [Chloroflexota bacterium]
GLKGLSLDSRLRQVFSLMSPERLKDLAARVPDEAREQGLVYLREGKVEVINVLLRPAGVMPDQLAYFHVVSLAILNALKRLPDLYIQDFAVRSVVPLSPDEEKWLWDTWGPSHRESHPVFGRLDAMVEFTSPMWKDSLNFVESNLCGVGGIHLIPTCERVVEKVVVPAMKELAPEVDIGGSLDLREMFLQEILDHLENIGHAGRNLCFIEPKYAGDGPNEQAVLTEYYRKNHGLTVVHADPAELYVKKGEVWYEDTRVDVGYRDYEVRDLIELEKDEGLDIKPMKILFRENRMVSSMAGDFDHKSCLEVLTDPQFAKYYSADERRYFRRHVLWTRLVGDRRTTNPEGESIDLVEYIRQNQDQLVLKPNRSYGGDRVIIGPSVGEGEWASAIEEALTGEDPFVAQRLARISVTEFPVVALDGSVRFEPFYTVMGFAPTKYGVAILGRASQKQVVNVAQRGGMCAVLVGKYAYQLRGPAATPVA